MDGHNLALISAGLNSITLIAGSRGNVLDKIIFFVVTVIAMSGSAALAGLTVAVIGLAIGMQGQTPGSAGQRRPSGLFQSGWRPAIWCPVGSCQHPRDYVS